MTTQNGNPANHLFAYAVEKHETSYGKKARNWTRFGAAFPHREGTVFKIRLRALPIASRIVLLPPDERDRGNNSNKDR